MMAIAITCSVAVPGAYANPLEDLGNAISNGVNGITQQLFGISLLSTDSEIELYAVEGADTVVDPDTTNAWETLAANSKSTENIGRIWTDKSVFNDDYNFEGALDDTSVVKGSDSDFLVSLSAISSTSNLKSVVTNITPLDIVLVVDTSGSMDNSDGHDMGYSYSSTYNVNNWGTYYIQVDGQWTELSHSNQSGWYYGSRYNPTYVTPARWEGDTEGGRVQFYTRSNQQMSRMEALQNAANAFVDSVAAMNDGITDTAQQHRISLVKFASDENNSIGNDTNRQGYNYSQVVSDLTAYTTQNASTLKNTINSLEGEGATRADYGMHQAQRVLDGDGNLTGARENAQKIVIFFTDGNPTTSQNWSNSVAGTAINYAYDMKQDGALVYSIGVFQGANPSDTNNDFNRYMNAVSSNYPDAQCGDEVYVGGGFWDPQYEWQQTDDYGDLVLGDRVEAAEGEETPQYYFAASNADELNQVFEDITESLPINQGSGSPIEEVEGSAGTPGYLTFTDTLGSFMEVTGVGADNDKMYLAFADGLHEGTTSDGGKTWEFSGVVNEGNGVNTAYPEGADLSEIKVTVTKSNDLAPGDTIAVQIPASLIPMRNYDVDTDNGTMTVSDTYPVRLFYGVSVKDGAIDALNDPQNANHDAVLAQTSADGKTIDFYSNSFVQGAAQGSTEASFTPSDGNKFYYYPVNTQLFIDENCNEPATRYNIGNYSKLYYQDSHWELTGTGDGAVEVPTVGSITRSGNDWHVTYQGNNAYIAANTPRADRPETLVSNKSDNTTDTASTVLTPTWVGNSVSQKLGNNGKLFVDAPGDLRIDKTVNWGNASSETQADKNSFKFTVHLYTVAEGGTQTNLTNQYDYAVYATGETPVSTGTISDNGEITLAAGQYVVISDLPNGAQYTVTERAANLNGFATTDNSTGENAKTDDGIVEGTIVGGSQQTASFTNTYHATEVTLEGANQLVKVQKNLTGREWQDTDEFRFTMLSEGNAPAPESTEAVVVDDEDAATDYTVNLSNIKFENPGTFTYVIEEDNDTNPIAGIDYSNETYAVTITVVDNGTGKLEIQSVQFEQRADVDGNEPAEQPQITDNTVVFTNNYDATEATTNLNGTKDYTDNSGANPNAAGKFTFELKAIGGYATEGGSAENPTIGSADVPMPEGADTNTHTITIGNNGTNPDGFAFQTIRYNGTHLNNTYIYEIREVIPQGATDNGDGTWSLNGMTYDGTVHTVTVEITDEPNEQGEGMHIVATPSMQPADVKFTNVYDPTDYTLTGDEAIHGTKVLQGREIGDNETFYFQLTQTGGPETVLADSEVKTVTKDSGMDFAFSELTFSKAGEYTFTVNEVADDQGTEAVDGSGMTYSQNVAKVTIKVKDGGNGALVLDGPVVYENQGSDETGKAVFTNVYEAELKYGAEGAGGINVTKQLLDRPMTAGEFDFTITGEGDAADLTTDADKSFQNTGAAADQTITMAKLQSLIFDETDAGKTYTFIVDETEPAEGDRLAGVTYDKSQYKVEIEVVDNGNGTMHAVTTVTQTMDRDGNEIADGGNVVVDHVNSDAVGYEAPTFGFVNDYNPNSVDMGEDTDNALQVTKKVIGAPSAADYTFTLTAQDTAEGPVANIKGLDENHQTTETTSGTIAAGETQTLSFDKLTFTEPGTYTFTVKENQPAADDGWTFDTNARTITVEVTDVNPAYEPGGDAPQYDGNLYIGEVTGNNPTIENEYDHGTVTIGGDAEEALTVEKTVEGWSTDADFHFTFVPVVEEGVDWSTVEIADGADKTAVTDDFADGDMHGAQFGEITFNEPGTYKFNVTEDEARDDIADPAGWTYDASTQTITVTVSETDADGNYDGKLHAAVDGPAKFENTYKAGTATVKGGEATFAGTKTIDGRDWLDKENFGFELTKGTVPEGASWDSVTYLPVNAAEDTEPAAFESATATANEKNDGNGTFWFAGTYLFSEPGTYTFNVTETQHNGDALPEDGTNGMTYDRHVGTITVEVTDDGSGTLQTEVTPGTGNASTTFVNTFEGKPYTFGLEDDEMLSGHKTVEDNVGSFQMADDQFTFVMRAQAEGNPMPDNLTVETDNNGYKVVSVKNANTDAQANTADYSFGSITFDHDDLAGVTDDDNDGKISKAFQYNVYENETDMPAGVSAVNPGRTYTVTITVTENLATGEITAEGEAVLLNSGDTENDPATLGSLDFVNKYDAGTITGGIQIYKTLNGRNWQQGDTFTFDVSMKADGVAKDDLPDFNFDNLAGTVNGYTEADGELSYNITINPSQSATGNSYAFGTGVPTYTHEGTYVYTITERDGTVEGVTKDSSTYVVTVVIKDVVENGKHVLNRTATIMRDGKPYEKTGRVDFTNTYTSTGELGGNGEVSIAANKTLTGRDMEKEEFTFKVTDKAGQTVSTGTNAFAEDGKAATITFSAIQYEIKDLELKSKDSEKTGVVKSVDDKTGLATYTISYKVEEDQTGLSDAGVTPDGATLFNITVVVADDGDGRLSVKVNYPTGTSSLDFKNIYEEKEGSDTEIAVEGTKSIESTMAGVDAPELKDSMFSFTLTVEQVDEYGNPVEGGKPAPMPEGTDTDGSKTVSNDAEGNVDFGIIDFTIESVWGRQVTTFAVGGVERDAYFKYTVTEEKSKVAGVTEDSVAKAFTVHVHDDGKGNVTVETDPDVTADTPLFSFVNKYTPEKVTVGKDGEASISVQKTLSGRNWIDGDSFEFVLTAGAVKDHDGNVISDATAPMPDGDGNKVTITNASDLKAATFGDITYDEIGTYEYTITEKNENKDGLTYDGHTATVTVEVTDTDADGKLEAKVTVENTGAVTEADAGKTDVAAFTNTYNAEGEASIEAEKTLSGRDLLEGEFAFEVKDAKGNVVAEGTNAGADEGKAAAISFGEISYDSNVLDELAKDKDSGVTKQVNEDGLATYTISYTVSEKTDDLPESVTAVGDTSYDVTVTVKDNGNGTMDASVDYGKVTAPLQFKNKYDETEQSVKGSKLDIVGEKVLESGMAGVDAPALEGGGFSFTLKPSKDNQDAPMPKGTVDGSKTVTNDADGNVDFGTIDYTLENTWGVTPLPNTLAATGEERVKTFTYEVTENAPADGEKMEGVTYDTSIKTIKVTVKDDGAGNITVTTNPDKAPLFTVTNTYTPEGTEIGGDGQAKLQVTKEVVGAPALSEFEFELKLKSGNKDDIKVKNDAGEDVSFPDGGVTASTVGLKDKQDSQTVSFGSMTFTKAGTYTFEVKETTTSDHDYWKYDNEPKTITVTVTDEDHDGKLEIAQDAIEGNNPIIQNVYTPASVTVGGDDALKVTKKVTGGNALSEFSFKLAFDTTNSNGALEDIEGITADGIVKSTVGLEGTQGEQVVNFGDLTFKKVGVYKFTVVETTTKPEGAHGWTYDNAAKTITVTVTDDGFDGQLDATTVVDGVDTNNPTVENVYSPDASNPNDAVISVIKKVSGAPALSEFEFELKLTSDNAVNVFVGSGESATAFPSKGLKTSTKNLTGKEGSETASFDGLTFTAAGEYTFTVTEFTTTAANGWTYDNAAKTITVTVEDQDGKLVVTNIDPETTTIENTYTPTGVTVGDDEADLQVTKKVTGGNAPTEFEFTLAFDADAEGNTGKLENIKGLGEDGTVTVSTSGLTGKQGEETVNFGDLTFSAVGDYYFTVTEITTTDDPNWAYDNAPKTIVVHVTDEDHDGQLDATVEFNNPTVENVYDEPYIPPIPVDPDPSDPSKPDTDVDKKLTGRDLVDGEFSFTITATGDNADDVSPKSLTGKNDASGNVTFGGKGFVFDKAGDYTFTVSEVLPADDDPETEGIQHNGVTYDETTFTITAHVTKQGNKLVVTWESADAPMVFENEYEPGEEPEPEEPTKPEEPSKPAEPEKPSKPGIPQTGDFAVAAIGGTGLAAVALIATGLYLRRRNSH